MVARRAPRPASRVPYVLTVFLGVGLAIVGLIVSLVGGVLTLVADERAFASDDPAGRPAPAPVPAARPPGTPVVVRFLRRAADGGEEPVPIVGVRVDATWLRGPGLASRGPLDRFTDGDHEVEVDDPHGVAGRVHLRITPDLPATLDVPLPRADDPVLDAFAVVVRDASTARPLPGATLHLFPYGDAPRVLTADLHGRIDVAASPRTPAGPGRSLFARLFGSGSNVRHPGSWPSAFGGGPHVDYDARPDAAHVVDARSLAELVRERSVTVAPTPVPASVRLRPARLRAADGGAVADAAVLAYTAAWIEFGAAITTFEAQVVRPDGAFDVPENDLVGLDVRVRGVAVATFAVAGGPVPDLRLPPLAEVTVVLDGVPADVRWSFEPYPEVRTPSDRPLVPVTWLPGAKAQERPGKLVLGRGGGDAYRRLATGRATLTVPVPVGVPRTLWFDASAAGPAPSDATGYRTLRLEVADPAPVRVERAWADLPVREVRTVTDE